MRRYILIGYVPQIWRQGKLAFIAKAGKPNHCKAKDLKALQLVIDMEIWSNLDIQISTSHHEYVKGNSVETALYSVEIALDMIKGFLL